MAVEIPELRTMREQRLLTQTDLASRARVSVATIRRIEGGAPARLSTARRLLDALEEVPREHALD